MKVINKEGIVFGKINIIDLFIVLFIIAVVVLGIMKLSEGKGPAFVSNTTKYELDIQYKSMYATFPDKINVGDKLYDHNSGSLLGEITNKVVTPAFRDVECADGTIVLSKVPERFDIMVTVSGEGIYNKENGLNIGGEMRYVGLFFRMKTANFLSDGVIIDLRVLGE